MQNTLYIYDYRDSSIRKKVEKWGAARGINVVFSTKLPEDFGDIKLLFVPDWYIGLDHVIENVPDNLKIVTRRDTGSNVSVIPDYREMLVMSNYRCEIGEDRGCTRITKKHKDTIKLFPSTMYPYKIDYTVPKNVVIIDLHSWETEWLNGALIDQVKQLLLNNITIYISCDCSYEDIAQNDELLNTKLCRSKVMGKLPENDDYEALWSRVGAFLTCHFWLGDYETYNSWVAGIPVCATTTDGRYVNLSNDLNVAQKVFSNHVPNVTEEGVSLDTLIDKLGKNVTPNIPYEDAQCLFYRQWDSIWHWANGHYDIIDEVHHKMLK